MALVSKMDLDDPKLDKEFSDFMATIKALPSVLQEPEILIRLKMESVFALSKVFQEYLDKGTIQKQELTLRIEIEKN